MSSVTPNYGLVLPGVNDPTDQDLWGGYLNTDLTTIDTTMKAISDVADSSRLPVGSLYFNATDATNPSILLGYGTWSAFGQGRVILGVGTGTDSNGDQLIVVGGATGGDYEHTLTIAEIPLHGHPFRLTGIASTGDINGGIQLDDDAVRTNYPAFTGTPSDTAGEQIGGTGGSGPHNNIQPYIGVWIWKRTA